MDRIRGDMVVRGRSVSFEETRRVGRVSFVACIPRFCVGVLHCAGLRMGRSFMELS